MYVCICSAITKKELEDLIDSDPKIDIEKLQELDICNNCYKCSYEIQKILSSKALDS
jgi:bacterioferritin-associated ferredoxin